MGPCEYVSGSCEDDATPAGRPQPVPAPHPFDPLLPLSPHPLSPSPLTWRGGTNGELPRVDLSVPSPLSAYAERGTGGEDKTEGFKGIQRDED
jgi:hypothetical protein